MDLTFVDRDLQELANRKAVMLKRVGAEGAETLAQLLNEIACADTLGLLELLPHLELVARKARVAVANAEARVLLVPDTAEGIDDLWAATMAEVVAIRVAQHDFNPQGEQWPQQAYATSQTTR